MRRMLVSEESRNNIELQDLSSVLREVTEDKQEWVYRYCDRRKLGKIIYKDFIHFNRSVMNQENTFMFSADLREEGILSLTQAFQVIATTMEGFGLEQDQELGEEVKERTLLMLDKIMDTVVTEEGLCKFDATPYLPETDHFTKENCKYAYIDTMTWVMSALLSVFRLHMNGIFTLNEERMEKAKKIYTYCIRYLLDSFIDGDENSDRFVCGWNYTKECNAPSLYFTFAVSELMIDILDTFDNVIRDADVDLIKGNIDIMLGKIATPEEIEEKKAQAELRYKEERKNMESGAERYVTEAKLFAEVNNGIGVYEDGSPYSRLESAVKKSVRNIWNLVKNNIADTFFASNLVSKVPESVIEQSIQSDAVFNTIFIINAVINSGLDEDAEDMIDYFTQNGSPEYEEALAEYDNIRDSLRIGYDNAYQFYVKMEKKKKAYKLNEYTLSFDEDFKGMEEQVKELRKARIRVFSLMPLLVKTKTTLGEFVIRYPQYDMQIYLENILSYRCVRKKYGLQDDYYWTWERDGYSSSSNYYFLSALNDFYNYYEKYELYASENALNNQKAKESVRSEYLEELEKSDGAIGQLRRKNQEQTEQIQELNTTLAAMEQKYAQLQYRFDNDPLRKALNDFVCTVVREHVLSMASIGGMLSDMSDSLTNAAMEKVARKAEGAADLRRDVAAVDQKWYRADAQAQDPQVRALEDGLRKFGVSLLSERILELLYADRVNSSYATEDYPETAERTLQDIGQVLRYYLAPMIYGQSSDYTATKGYGGLPQIIAKEKANNKKSNG